ncbi:MAG: glycoside hydrolase family 127 protein [Phycisphaerae bacterium]|jgi:hypothetical protein|nr:glycoside hydrolase family 127 protein [Phycisphaerae bacterium]
MKMKKTRQARIAPSCDAAVRPVDKVAPKIPIEVHPFSLHDVRLLGGPFKNAMDLNGEYLLELEPDRLLHNFRKFAGLKPKGKRYAGWEKDSIAGHTLGHYLSACSLHYASTGSRKHLKRVDYMLSELRACQQANGNGLVFGFPRGKEIFEELGAGDIRAEAFDLNGCWVPLYNLHKTFAGLHDAYALCGRALALTISRELGDFLIGVFDNLSKAQMQSVLSAEQGGINESFADLYRLTGGKKYLAMAERIYHEKVLGPLSRKRDILPGLHGNTQIPKVIGCARLFELTGSAKYRTAASFFWDTVIAHHTYVNGGNGDNEYFGARDKRASRLGCTTETCNTYNMLRLTRFLYGWKPRAAYFDYFERALYNHILASQNPETGMTVYKGYLSMPGRKSFCSPLGSFWCCTGTGIENHARYGESIYWRDAKSLYVNLYIPSVLKDTRRGVRVRMETDFPLGDSVKLKITCDKPTNLAIKLRRPKWTDKGMTVTVNGAEVESDAKAGSYITLQRKWTSGDVIGVRMPMSLRYQATPDAADRVAFLYGPILLCAPLRKRADMPVLVTAIDELLDNIRCVKGKPLSFRTKGLGTPHDVTLRAHYAVYKSLYTVYMDVFTKDGWAKKQAEYEAETQRLEALRKRTCDNMRIGEMQPERDHKLKSSKASYVGRYLDRKYRDARSGGFFDFDMKVDPDKPIDLVCTWWSDRTRVFDILVDDRKIATVNTDKLPGDRFVDIFYPIDRKLTKGRKKVRVRFQGAKNHHVARLFGCKTVLRKKTR